MNKHLLMNLAKASSAGKQSRTLDQWFDALDNAGWLIELARVHLRLATGVALPHGVFAQALQLRVGRSYRLVLLREDELRARLVDVARYVITSASVIDDLAIARMQRTLEYSRFQRSINISWSYGLQRKGRKLGETFYVADKPGEELEALRVQSGLTLKHWTVQIGTSENTYRRKLEDSTVPPEWLDAARALVVRRQDALLAYRAQETPVTDEELLAAFTKVWSSYQARTQPSAMVKPVAVRETDEQKAARQAQEDAELLKYTPSAEEDSETEIELDLGSTVDATDRAQPEDLDDRAE